MRRLILLLPLFLAACWPFNSGGAGPTGDVVVLCVENAAVGYGNIIARSDLVRIDVLPGQTVCKRLSASVNSARLTAASTGGGAAGPFSVTDRLPSTLPGCWLWHVAPAGGSRISSIDCTNVPEAQTIRPSRGEALARIAALAGDGWPGASAF